MYPVPSEDRSIIPRFGKAVRYKPSMVEAYYDSRAPIHQRDAQAAAFAKNPEHVIWGHLSPANHDYHHAIKRHVKDTERHQKESKKRSKYECEPLPETYVRCKLLPPMPSNSGVLNTSNSISLTAIPELKEVSGLLANPRPQVVELAAKFSHKPFLLNVGEDPRNQLAAKPREVDPNMRASSNPLLIGDDVASIVVRQGKRALELPRAATVDPPPTFAASPSFAKYSAEELKSGKRLVHPQSDTAFDPLQIKSTNGGRRLDALQQVSPDLSSKMFVVQQQELARKLGRPLLGF